MYLQYLLRVCPHPVTAGGQTGGQEAPGHRGPVGRGWETPVKLGVASFTASYYPNSSAPQPEYSSERAKDGHPEMTPQVTLFQTQTLINTQRATDHLSTPRLWEKGQRINAGEHLHTRGCDELPQREARLCVRVPDTGPVVGRTGHPQSSRRCPSDLSSPNKDLIILINASSQQSLNWYKCICK